jgi:hypothetical protein
MTAIDRALAFLDAHGRPVEAAWARHVCAGEPREAVLDALVTYQNPDGGFGNGLEPDIAAPESQAFAARLAMHILISIGAEPKEPIVARLAGWLEAAQAKDGDWPFSAGVREHALAPWFAGWTFPSLNPALCLAGAATRLGIGSDRLHGRVRALADRLASADAIGQGGFYDVLPYAEYFPWVEHPDRETFLSALVAKVETDARGGAYADAGHFFEHVGPPDGVLARRLPPDLLATYLDRLLAEQEADGGWPSPYNPVWRSVATAAGAVTLRRYGRG